MSEVELATEKIYFQMGSMTPKQHVLERPGMYIGPIQTTEAMDWLLTEDVDSKTVSIHNSTFQCNYGLYKLYDEAILNCRDHCVRMADKIRDQVENSLPVTYVNVDISEDGAISMTNDGNSLDVAKNENGDWYPELAFTRLLHSMNYDDTNKSIGSGCNGVGVKAVLIWSTWGVIETVDHIRGLKYVQEFRDNLDVICLPVITKCKSKPYTKITFRPDYARLGIPGGLSADMLALFKRRVYDIAAVTDQKVKVRYNDVLVPVKSFEQYVKLFAGTYTYESGSDTDRWEYAIAMSEIGEFGHISFVNGIYTAKGGKHVDYIMSQITNKLVQYIEDKKKVKVTPASIKEQLMLFLRCDIVKPTFDSQTKNYMSTPAALFGSKCTVSDKFVEKIAKMGVMSTACEISKIKELKSMKKLDGSKKRRINIPKLDDANFAGTAKSAQCICIFCEGDSAKTGLISGLTAEDKDTIGIFPLKGKLLNVRGMSQSDIVTNQEVYNIIQILGLEIGKKYHTMEDVHANLRYGRIAFATDQDLDGSHIKGLGINMFSTCWAELCAIPGFITYMNTPILKATRGQQIQTFYNVNEYNVWKSEKTATELAKWAIKYYKGLGTSTALEFKAYMRERKFIGFQTTPTSADKLDMVFNKKRADNRKEWLDGYDRTSCINTSLPMVTYDEFIDQELIHFSKYDCERNMANAIDGLKTSQRKILFTAFKRNLTSEIKVAQFGASVAEISAYHHGEASLMAAIVGMAQNFVGANNLNLLFPSGQFGSRLKGGEDSSSERYIYTYLSRVTRCLFPKEDDDILEYVNDDGHIVEPTFYIPIIPLIAVNGSVGIGTGFSSTVYSHNSLHIIDYLERRLRGGAAGDAAAVDGTEFVPYYEGFQGKITTLIPNVQYLCKGVYERVNENTIRVTELPVGYWTDDFIEHLSKLRGDSVPAAVLNKKKPGVAAKKSAASSSSSATAANTPDPIIKDFKPNCTDDTINVSIQFVDGKLAELLATADGADADADAAAEGHINKLEKVLKLTKTFSNKNMNLYDAHDKLVKYASIKDIIDAFYPVRLDAYNRRKAHQLSVMERDLVIYENKARYITEINSEVLVLNRKKTSEIVALLAARGYATPVDSKTQEPDTEYDYLLSMRMSSVTAEAHAALMRKAEEKRAELETLRATPVEMIWFNELQVLRTSIAAHRQDMVALREAGAAGGTLKVSAVTKKPRKPKAAASAATA